MWAGSIKGDVKRKHLSLCDRRVAHTLAAGAHIGFYVRAWAVQADWRTEVALRFVGGEHEFAALFPHLGGAYVPTLFGGMYAPLGDAW